jgi:hypothetical protein
MSQVSSGLVTVQFLQFPVDVYQRAQEHNDGLMREFSLIAGGDADAVPRRLLELAERLEREYGDYAAGYEQQLDAASAAGETSVDLALSVPPQAKEAAAELRQMMAAADEYCARGDLLSLVPQPDVLALREWYIGEVIRQIDGEPPTSWSDHYKP